MKDWMKYALAIIGGGIFFYLISRGQQAATISRATMPTPTTETETIYEVGQEVPVPIGEEPESPAGPVEAEVAEDGMVEVTQMYTPEQNQNCAYNWLTQNCPEYQENNCYMATQSPSGYTMTGDRMYFFTYYCSCFKEGTWGVPVPSTIKFTVTMKDCQLRGYTYKVL